MRVVIVGAGPAGLITALNLIQVGINPLILEKQAAIKSTACAEGCALQSLDSIPFDSERYISKKVKGAKIICADGSFTHTTKHTAVLDRIGWLEGMAQQITATGGQLRFNAGVTAIGENSLQLKDGEKIDYDVLIGSDGPNSIVARQMGIKHQTVVACQYKLAGDTTGMDYLELYVDRRFSSGYSWIFPKDGVINIGGEGDFAQLDTFVKHKGLDNLKILSREAGAIPVSGIQKLVQHNMALIGDAAAMPNPISGGGLTPIILAAQILAEHIHDLDNYERKVKQHPIAAPALSKARDVLLQLPDKDLVKLMAIVTSPPRGIIMVKLPPIMRIITRTMKYPHLLLKLHKNLIGSYQAAKISKEYGW